MRRFIRSWYSSVLVSLLLVILGGCTTVPALNISKDSWDTFHDCELYRNLAIAKVESLAIVQTRLEEARKLSQGGHLSHGEDAALQEAYGSLNDDFEAIRADYDNAE